MALNMENPLQPSFEGQLSKTVQDTQACISELRKEWSDGGVPLTDDSQTLQRFCAKLEYLLQAGMKSKSSLIGGKKDYWNYIGDCLSGNKGLNDGIRFVKSLSELKSNLGRGRALVRFCLVHHRLADTIQQCVYNHKVTNDWYTSSAIWVQPHAVSALINSLYDLNDLQFDLSPSGYDLDTSWPSFARKSFGGSSQWAPPSRTISVSSLASTQDMSMSLGSDAEVERYRSQLTDTESEKHHLQVKLESVEDDRATQSRKLADLEIQLSNTQRVCNQFEVQCDKLETEIKLREETWVEKEALWKVRLHESDKTVADLNDALRKARDSKQATTSSAGAAGNGILDQFEFTEMKAKLATERKTISALKIDLHSCNLELRMKEKLDAGKTHLIELLEKKLKQTQDQNKNLMTRLEDSTAKPMEAQEGRLNELIEQLQISEKANQDVMKVNTELRTMLHELEEKCGKIAKLAKEKVLKYVEQNKLLQETVEELTSKLKNVCDSVDSEKASIPDVSKESNSHEVHRLSEELREAKQKIEELQGCLQKVEQPPDGGQDISIPATDSPILKMKFGYEKLQEQIQSGGDVESIQKVKVEKSELEAKLLELEANNEKLNSENQELNGLLLSKNIELSDLQKDLAGVKGALLHLEKNIDAPPPEAQDDSPESPLVSRARTLILEHAQLTTQLQAAESTVIDLKERLEGEGSSSSELQEKLIQSHRELAEVKASAVEAETSSVTQGARLKELETSLETKVKDLHALECQLRDQQQVIEKLEEASAKLKEETCDLVTTKSELDATVTDNTRIIQDLNVQKSELENKLLIISSDKQQSDTQSGDLAKQNKELETQNREVNILLESKQKEYEQLESHYAEVLSIKDILVKDKEKLQCEVESLRLEAASSRTKLQEVSQELVTCQGEVKKLELRLEQTTEGSSALDGQVSALHGELMSEKARIVTLTADIEKIRSDTNEKDNTIANLESTMKQSEEKYVLSMNEKNSQVEALQAQNAQSLTELNEVIDNLKNDICKQETKLASFEAQVANLNGEIETLNVAKCNLIQEKEESVSKSSQLQEAICDIQEQLMSLQTKHDEIKQSHSDEIDRLSQAKGDIENDNTELKEKLLNLNSDLKALEEKYLHVQETMQSDLALSSEAMSEVKGEVVQLEMDRNRIQQALEEERQQCQTVTMEKCDIIQEKEQVEKLVEELKNDKASLESSISSLKENIAELKSDLELIDKEKVSLEENLTAMTEEVEKVSVEKNNLVSSSDLMKMKVNQMETMMEAKTKEVSQLEHDLHEKDIQCTELKDMVAQLEEEKESLNSNLEASLVELGQIEKKLEFAEGENKEICEKLQQSSSQNENDSETLAAIREELQSKIDALTSEKADVVEKLERARDENKKSQEECEAKQSQLTELLGEVESLTSGLSDTEQTLKMCEERLGSCQSEWEQQKESLESELSALKFELSTNQLQRQSSQVEDVKNQLSQSEVMIEQLETQLEDLGVEYTELEEKLRTAEKALDVKEGECLFHTGQLEQLRSQHEELVERHRRFQEENEITAEQHEVQVQQFMAEMDGIKDDNKNLKEQLVKIVKDKASLWQQKDQLDVIRQMVVGAKWMDSSTVTHCLKCKQEFTIFVRKHHCRLCGRIFCSNCCDNWILTAYSSKKERTCDECVMAHSLAETAIKQSAQDESCDSDPEAKGSHSMNSSTASGLPESTEPITLEDPPETQASGHSETETSEEKQAVGSPGKEKVNETAAGSPLATSPRDRSLTASAIGAAAEWLFGRKTSAADGRIPENPPSMGSSPSGADIAAAGIEIDAEANHSDDDSFVHITEDERVDTFYDQPVETDTAAQSSDASVGDDPYDLITQDEIIESLHESIIEHDPKMMSHGTIRVEDLTDGTLTSDPELWVKPGMTFAIPIMIPRVGYKLRWEFKTQPKDIGFGLTYRESLLNYDEEGSILVNTVKCNSHKRPIQGELVARQTGIYTLLFDNTHSRFTHKQLEYKLEVQPPEQVTDEEAPPDTQTAQVDDQ